VQKLKDLFQYTWSKLMNDATLPLSRRKMRSPILPQNDAQGIQIQWKLDDRVSIGKPQIKATKDWDRSVNHSQRSNKSIELLSWMLNVLLVFALIQQQVPNFIQKITACAKR